jgi:DNA-binding response OmpR family regulator
MARKRVLVADDEPAVLRFVEIALSRAGYDVTTTTSGEEALNLARTVNPDVVLLDVLMVPIGGFEVLDRLRTFSAVPVIMFTARSYIADQATRFGANGFIAKPFRPQQLLDKIEGALNDSRRGSTQ